MQNDTDRKTLTIVGGGIAGCAAALRACQYNIPCYWIRGSKSDWKRSRAKWVYNIDNMIGIHPNIVLNKLKSAFKNNEEVLDALNGVNHLPISTMDIIENVMERIEAYGDFIEIIDDSVEEINDLGTMFKIKTAQNCYITPYVICSTGLMDVQPHIYKQLSKKIDVATKWIYPYANNETVLYCLRCEGHLTNHKQCVLLGNTEVTAQVALMMTERYGSISAIITNGEQTTFTDDTTKLIDHYGIKVHNSKILDVKGKMGKLEKFILEDDLEVQTDFALVSMGTYQVYHQYIDRNLINFVGKGDHNKLRVEIDKSGETKTTNLFCIGDMALRPDESVMMQIYTAQEYAVRAVDTIDRRRRKILRERILKTIGHT